MCVTWVCVLNEYVCLCVTWVCVFVFREGGEREGRHFPCLHHTAEADQANRVSDRPRCHGSGGRVGLLVSTFLLFHPHPVGHRSGGLLGNISIVDCRMLLSAFKKCIQNSSRHMKGLQNPTLFYLNLLKFYIY